MSGSAVRWIGKVVTFAAFALLPLSWVTGWINSVAFVNIISLVALALSGWTLWQGGRVEEKQDGASPPAIVMGGDPPLQVYAGDDTAGPPEVHKRPGAGFTPHL